MVIVSHCLREYVVVSITCLIILKRYRGFLMEFVKYFYVRTYFPLPCVCVCFSQKKKKIVFNLFTLSSHTKYKLSIPLFVFHLLIKIH